MRARSPMPSGGATSNGVVVVDKVADKLETSNTPLPNRRAFVRIERRPPMITAGAGCRPRRCRNHPKPASGVRVGSIQTLAPIGADSGLALRRFSSLHETLLTTKTSAVSVIRTSWALFVALALVMVGNGLQGSLIGVRTQVESFSDGATGFIITGYYAGFLVGSWFIPRVLREVGHIRVFVGLASVVSATVLIHAMWVNEFAWIFLRLATGLAMAGLYVTVESWLNEQATNETRGRTMSAYMYVLTGSIIAGQGLLGTADVRGFFLFIVASLFVSLAVVPLALSPIPAPRFDVPESLPLRQLFRMAPLGVVSGFLTGASNGALIGMTSVWASSAGLSPSRAGLLVAAGLAGSLFLQWPLGSLSDRLPRRRVIFAAASGAVLTAAFALSVDPASGLMVLVLFLYGGFTYPLYSLSASHINDAVPKGKVVAAASGFVFVVGLGAVVGPLTVTIMTSIFGGTGFFWALGLLLLPVALFSLYRVYRYVTPDQRPFIPLPVRSTSMLVSGVVRRRQRNNGPRVPPS